MNGRYDYDYSKLKGKLREKGYTYKNFAYILGISETSVSERMNNNAQFTQEEIGITVANLGIDSSKIKEFFFTHRV